MSLRVLVADDSVIFRRVLADALTSLSGVEVVGCVPNGRMAVQKVRELKPDLLTLDLEMPEMGGLAVLDALRAASDNTMVLVVSALTSRGGSLTMQALEKGAIDFITKPSARNSDENRAIILKELAQRLPALAHRHAVRKILKNESPSGAAAAPKAREADFNRACETMSRIANLRRPSLVLIGVSTGGPNALAQLLPDIPENIGVPLLVVQHMPPVFTQSLAESLAAKCSLEVHEAVDGEALSQNTVYIAPGGRHMRVAAAAGGRKVIQITDDPPENNCKPAVDYLFRSVAERFPGSAMAVILTGMGNDGTAGLRLLKRHGCYVIAQDESSSVVFGMPKSAVEAGVVDAVMPLEDIAAGITAAVRGYSL